jgi:hypothetical protein
VLANGTGKYPGGSFRRECPGGKAYRDRQGLKEPRASECDRQEQKQRQSKSFCAAHKNKGAVKTKDGSSRQRQYGSHKDGR